MKLPCSNQSTTFQFTRPRGARPAPFDVWVMFAEVSIHAPAWGATGRAPERFVFVGFQFTRPRGARRSRSASPGSTCSFNSRARVGRDLQAYLAYTESDRFQFTRPRGARRAADLHPRRPGRVSIHAPAWGATPAAAERKSQRCFNSRARVGRDPTASARSATDRKSVV